MREVRIRRDDDSLFTRRASEKLVIGDGAEADVEGMNCIMPLVGQPRSQAR
jgi:hypothetical protein